MLVGLQRKEKFNSADCEDMLNDADDQNNSVSFFCSLKKIRLRGKYMVMLRRIW